MRISDWSSDVCSSDLNKRTAWVAARLFFAMNQIELMFNKRDAIPIVLALAAGELPAEELARWFRDHSVQRSASVGYRPYVLRKAPRLSPVPGYSIGVTSRLHEHGRRICRAPQRLRLPGPPHYN